MINDEQRGFRGRRGCVDQIFTQKQMGEKKHSVCVCFMDLEKAHDQVKVSFMSDG